MQQIGGLLRPDHGTVLFDGLDIFKDSKVFRKLRYKIGLVFQNPEEQLFSETIFKDIAFGPHNMGLSRDSIVKRVLEAINFVGLDKSILSRSPFEISGGEKRRVAIAGVIAMRPEILILDEPTVGLDFEGSRSILSYIKQYHRENKNTLILISHNMDDIINLTDKVAVMSAGEIKAFGKTGKIFDDPVLLHSLKIDVPEITKIMKKLKEKGFNLKDSVFTEQEALQEILRLKYTI